MALKAVKKCSLATEIIVHTKRKGIIHAMNPKRLKTLNKKTNGHAFLIMECHGIMSAIALKGASVTFTKNQCKGSAGGE